MKMTTIMQDHRETLVDCFEETKQAIDFCGIDNKSFMEPEDDFYLHHIFSSDTPQEVIDWVFEKSNEGRSSILVDITFTSLEDLVSQFDKLEYEQENA